MREADQVDSTQSGSVGHEHCAFDAIRHRPEQRADEQHIVPAVPAAVICLSKLAWRSPSWHRARQQHTRTHLVQTKLKAAPQDAMK